MISASANFATVIASDDRQFTSRLTVNGTELDGDLQAWELTKGSCGGAEFDIGAVMSSVFNATIKNLTTQVKNEDIKVEIGLMVNGAYEYITLGYFTATEVKKTHYQTEITAYGHSVSKTGDILAMSTTQTLANIKNALSSATGVNVALPASVDSTLEITKSLAGLTCYQVLQILASVVGGYVIDEADGSIGVHLYDATTTLSVDTDRMRELPDVEEQDFTVTGIQVTVEDVIIASSGTITLEIDNDYVTQDLFDDELEPNLVGYSYRPATIDLSKGDPRLEGNDVLSVTDIDGSVYIVPCHSVTHIYDGGLATTVESIRATQIADYEATTAPISTKIKENEKQIVEVGRIASNTNQYFWFTGTGTDTGAHITEVPQDEFTDPSDPNYQSGGNLLARSNGIAARDGLTELATFGATGATIGETGKTHIEMDYHSFQMVDKDGNTYAYISDLRGTNGTFTITEAFTSTSSGYLNFNLSVLSTTTNYSVKVNGTEVTSGIVKGVDYFSINGGYASGTTFVATYPSADDRLKAFTFGIRGNGDVALMSFAEGYENIASGMYSHAEGNGTTSSGYSAHAEGSDTTASGSSAHAEGYQCFASGNHAHAEGIGTTASSTYGSHAEGRGTTSSGGWGSHAEGYLSIASAGASHAQNTGTIASSGSQTALGKYNVEDANDTYAVIVGNGTAGNARSNALTVGWSGDTKVSGHIYAEGHTNYIGASSSYNDTKTINSGTSFVALSGPIQLSAGTFILVGTADFPVNGTGTRAVVWYDGSSIINASLTQVSAVSGFRTRIQSVAIVKPSAITNYTLDCYQNSTSALSVNWHTAFIRIA